MADAGRFTAIVLEENAEGIRASVRSLDNASLPEGDVTVAVEYSTVNYKDGLILAGLGRLVRRYPHVPGIDFAGTVEASTSPRFRPGDKVILTGWRVGETHWGGFATRARVRSEWLVPVPEGMTTRQAMAIGTAGFTAMLAVMALEEHGLASSEEAPVLVTGAAGGVGGVATLMLSAAGHWVAASTGREDAHAYLRGLGAREIVPRSELEAPAKGPLAKEQWSGAIDSVGGKILPAVLSALRYGSCCAAVGNAGGLGLETTVLPFLLRGITLQGIDSVLCPLGRREHAWHRLARAFPLERLEDLLEEATLADVPALGGKILQGGQRGRAVIKMEP